MILLIIIIALVLVIAQSENNGVTIVNHPTTHHVHPPKYIVNGKEVSYSEYKSILNKINHA